MHPLLDLRDHKVGLHGLRPDVAAEVALPAPPLHREGVLRKDRLQPRLALEGAHRDGFGHPRVWLPGLCFLLKQSHHQNCVSINNNDRNMSLEHSCATEWLMAMYSRKYHFIMALKSLSATAAHAVSAMTNVSLT